MQRRTLPGLLLISAVLTLLISCTSERVDPAATAPNSVEAASKPESRKLIASKESPYNNVYVYQEGKNLSMTFGINKDIWEESIYNPADDRELPVPYTQYMTATLIYPPKVKSILEIGFGGGRTAWYFHRFLPDVEVTAVELDPAVVELAHKYFGVRDEPHFRVINKDGRIFLTGSKEKYDVILIDAYRGPFVPFHLLTQEFYRIVQQHLAEGGVVAQNVEPSTMLFDSTVKTMHAVFQQLEFYDASNGQSALTGKDVGGNLVTIAYDGDAINLADASHMADEHQAAYALRYDLRAMLRFRYLLKPVTADGRPYLDVVDAAGFETGGIDDKAPILTDDFAPVGSLKAIEKHNRKWTTTSP